MATLNDLAHAITYYENILKDADISMKNRSAFRARITAIEDAAFSEMQIRVVRASDDGDIPLDEKVQRMFDKLQTWFTEMIETESNKP